MSKLERRVAAWIILLLWAAAFTRLIIDPTLPIPLAVATPVMLVAVGYLFGQDLREALLRPRKDPDA